MAPMISTALWVVCAAAAPAKGYDRPLPELSLPLKVQVEDALGQLTEHEDRDEMNQRFFEQAGNGLRPLFEWNGRMGGALQTRLAGELKGTPKNGSTLLVYVWLPDTLVPIAEAWLVKVDAKRTPLDGFRVSHFDASGRSYSTIGLSGMVRTDWVSDAPSAAHAPWQHKVTFAGLDRPGQPNPKHQTLQYVDRKSHERLMFELNDDECDAVYQRAAGAEAVLLNVSGSFAGGQLSLTFPKSPKPYQVVLAPNRTSLTCTGPDGKSQVFHRDDALEDAKSAPRLTAPFELDSRELHQTRAPAHLFDRLINAQSGVLTGECIDRVAMAGELTVNGRSYLLASFHDTCTYPSTGTWIFSLDGKHQPDGLMRLGWASDVYDRAWHATVSADGKVRVVSWMVTHGEADRVEGPEVAEASLDAFSPWGLSPTPKAVHAAYEDPRTHEVLVLSTDEDEQLAVFRSSSEGDERQVPIDGKFSSKKLSVRFTKDGKPYPIELSQDGKTLRCTSPDGKVHTFNSKP